MKNFWARIKAIFNRYFSAAYAVMLLLAFILWYISKLSYTYTTELPLTVDIDGTKMKVTCLVQGTGYRLFAHRYYMSKRVNLQWNDVETSQSPTHSERVVINPFSLQNAISVRNADIKVISIGTLPEVYPSKRE